MRCIRRPQVVDPKGLIGPRENPEAWCGRRFDGECLVCNGKGKIADEFAPGGLTKCTRCKGRRLEPMAGDAVPVSIEEAISGAKGSTCAKCRNAVAEALDRAT